MEVVRAGKQTCARGSPGLFVIERQGAGEEREIPLGDLKLGERRIAYPADYCTDGGYTTLPVRPSCRAANAGAAGVHWVVTYVVSQLAIDRKDVPLVVKPVPLPSTQPVHTRLPTYLRSLNNGGGRWLRVAFLQPASALVLTVHPSLGTRASGHSIFMSR